MSEKPAHESEKSEDPAIAALKRLARPQPKAVGEPLPPAPEAPVGSATGFVGTLGKQPGGPLPGDSVAGAAGVKGANTLGMAREVRPKRSLSPLAEIAEAAAKEEEPESSDEAVPSPPPRGAGTTPYIMMSLAVILLVIGAWAVGALMYMKNFQPMSRGDVNYPFIVWHIDLHSGGAYTSASVAMAWSMLLCLPVATLLLILGWSMRRRRP